MEQQLIKNLNEIQIGDEIIISSYSNLKYLRIVQIPKKKDGSRFKVSIKKMQRRNGNYSWTVNSFEQNIEEHNSVVYQELYGRDVFLVKRKNNN